MKIATKIGLFILLGAASVSVLVGILSYNYNKKLLEGSINTEHLQRAEATMNQIDHGMFSQYQGLESVATRVTVRGLLSGQSSDQDKAIVVDMLQENMNLYLEVTATDVIAPDGTIIISTDQSRTGMNVAEMGVICKEMLDKALQGQVNNSDVHRPEKMNDPKISFMAPVYSANEDRIIGAVETFVDWQIMSNSLKDTSDPVARIYNKNGELLSAKGENGRNVFYPGDSNKSALIAALQSDLEVGVLPNIKDGTDTVTAIAKQKGFGDYVGNGWVLITQMPVKEAFAGATRNAVSLSILLGALIMLVAFAVLLVINLLVVRPLAILTENVKDIDSENNLGKEIVTNSHDEIGDLAQAFNKLTEKLRNSYVDLEKQFDLKTAKLAETLEEVKKKNDILENAKRAMLNILEDFEESKKLVEEEKSRYEAERDRGEGILRYLHAIGEGVIATDIKGKLIFVNLTAAKVVAREEGSPLIGKNYRKEFVFVLGADSDAVPIDPVAEAMKTSRAYVLPTNCYLITGEEKIPVAGSFAPIIKEDKLLGVVSVFQDITERYKLEKEKDDFISIAAHQLRTPLTGIRWVIEMLLDGDAGKLPKEAQTYLKQILENNQRLVTLVNDLLDVSKINMGRSKEEFTAVDIAESVQQVIETMKGVSSDRGVSVVCENNCPKGTLVEAGPKHLFQAFENLVSNAIKYTPEKGEIKIKLEVQDKNVLLSVADNGIGIPKKDQQKIFSKFFRAGNAVLKETEGSGLGLNVVKSFIEESGGKVWFESEEGKGTTFFVELPVTVV